MSYSYTRIMLSAAANSACAAGVSWYPDRYVSEGIQLTTGSKETQILSPYKVISNLTACEGSQSENDLETQVEQTVENVSYVTTGVAFVSYCVGLAGSYALSTTVLCSEIGAASLLANSAYGVCTAAAAAGPIAVGVVATVVVAACVVDYFTNDKVTNYSTADGALPLFYSNYGLDSDYEAGPVDPTPSAYAGTSWALAAMNPLAVTPFIQTSYLCKMAEDLSDFDLPVDAQDDALPVAHPLSVLSRHNTSSTYTITLTDATFYPVDAWSAYCLNATGTLGRTFAVVAEGNHKGENLGDAEFISFLDEYPCAFPRVHYADIDMTVSKYVGKKKTATVTPVYIDRSKARGVVLRLEDKTSIFSQVGVDLSYDDIAKDTTDAANFGKHSSAMKVTKNGYGDECKSLMAHIARDCIRQQANLESTDPPVSVGYLTGGAVAQYYGTASEDDYDTYRYYVSNLKTRAADSLCDFALANASRSTYATYRPWISKSDATAYLPQLYANIGRFNLAALHTLEFTDDVLRFTPGSSTLLPLYTAFLGNIVSAGTAMSSTPYYYSLVRGKCSMSAKNPYVTRSHPYISGTSVYIPIGPFSVATSAPGEHSAGYCTLSPDQWYGFGAATTQDPGAGYLGYNVCEDAGDILPDPTYMPTLYEEEGTTYAYCPLVVGLIPHETSDDASVKLRWIDIAEDGVVLAEAAGGKS